VTQYVYHLIRNIQGDTLYPLNKLKDIYPDIYEQHKRKYVGRKRVMSFKIPYLNVLWNDTLMFTPINPEIVKDEILRAGLNTNILDDYIKVPIEDLNPANTVWFEHSEGVVNKQKNKSEEIYPFDFKQYRELTELPEHTKRYLQTVKANNQKKFFIYLGIPHILTTDSINISKYLVNK